MKKLGLLLCTTGILVLAACSTTAAQLKDLPERDARFIVEVDKDINKLSEKGALKTQYAVYNNIKAVATSNIRMLDNYTVLNNAFVIEASSNDLESIKSVPGVKSVTVDKLHWVREINNDGYIPLNGDEAGDAVDESKNISAETMKMPEDNNEGEGTIVAILDNEFHFRGNYTCMHCNDCDKDFELYDLNGSITCPNCKGLLVESHKDGWNHEVYSPLSDDVAVRYTFDDIKGVSGLRAGTVKSGSEAGDEGSLYYNNKVPFYYDYGGTSKYYGKRGAKKHDVHSDLSYHGSHVSSITAANAPEYKGIAPKAQLALMKVFTDYDSRGLGEKLGLTSHTGAYDTSILEALQDCIKLKVDGINMSLGSDLDDFDSDSITLKTLSSLKENGILTSISAGNSGKSSYSSTGAYGNWMPESVETGIMSSYANNANSMTIASGHPTQIFYENAFVINNENIAFEDQITNRPGMDDDYDEEHRIVDLYKGEPLEWVYVPGFGTSGDYEGLDVKGKIAVVNRGSTAFADKYSVAASKKAKGMVIINNDPTASSFNFRCSFGDTQPTIPIALVLYKDKPVFETAGSGTFDIINKRVSDNPAKYTVSNFSTDGATFDLDLKPEITAPGDNIRGAVPEHAMTNLTKEERESPQYKYKSYQYLSGTSMSAPNYAGAQALVLSEKTAPIYQAAKAAGRSINSEEALEIDEYRETVNMRLMSTADPMRDFVANPEDATETKSLTSPRIQGAGMVDLEGALSTDVYLEGLDLNGNKIGKSKIALRNNDDIAKGDIKLSFLAHNESDEAREYDVTLTVMRPAIAHPNDIVTKDYNFKGTVEKIENFNGMRYYDSDLKRMETATGSVAYKDAVEVSKDIEYYANEEDFNNKHKTVIAKGFYYNSSTTEVACWDPLPSYTAQSTMDVEIAHVTGQTVTVAASGETTVTIDTYSLTEAQKDEILSVYEYGCMIEGFVTLTSKDGHVDLSIPYLGFYSGTDRDPEASYENAPVTEPFNFEKDPTKVYPSYLVNDIAKSLVGKYKCNFESMIVAGHADSPQKINTDKVLSNDLSFDSMSGFYKVGTNPINDEYDDDPSNNIYIGSDATNTMIIQQFILRSVSENNFTIKNKETGKLVYASVLQDMLYGDTADKWALHKSHVAYLTSGYVATRAYAIVPLYDEVTGERFPSGSYELTFNYQLAYNGNWVKKTYDLNIDSEAPVVQSIAQYKAADGTDRVRIYFEDAKLSYGIIGYNRVDVHYDADAKKYYIDETKEFVDTRINNISKGQDSQRLFISAVDYARGKTGAIVHMNDYNDFSKGYQIVQGTGVTANLDFDFNENNKLFFINTNTGADANVSGDITISKFAAVPSASSVAHLNPTPVEPTSTEEVVLEAETPASAEPAPVPATVEPETETAANVPSTDTNTNMAAKKGCNGALASMSLIISIPALMGATILFFNKRKGGKQSMKMKNITGLLVIGLMSFGALVGCNETPSVPGGDSNTSVPSGSLNPQPGTSTPSASNPSGGSNSSSSTPAGSTSSQAPARFAFQASINNGKNTMEVGDTATIEIETRNDDGSARVYRYSIPNNDDKSRASLENGVVTALAAGQVTIKVQESTSRTQSSFTITIREKGALTIADGGYNYASLAGEEAIETRTEILGQLEKYAMDTHLTGITLFENGGYVKYSERVDLPTTNYITGYGFGLLGEGKLTAEMSGETNPKYKMYLHSATSSDPGTINARNDTGSQVSDLESYITASYWGTKMNAKKTQYVWYPVLAKDTVKYNGVDQEFTRPIPVFNDEEVVPGTDPNPLGLYKTWRIYVKTSEVKYGYNGNAWEGAPNFNGRSVELADYEFAYRLLLTGAHKLKRGSESASDKTYGIMGAQSYYNRTKEATDEEAKNTWNTMKADGRLGFKTGTDSVNGPYIQLTLVNAIDRFTAMYALSSNLVSPIPEVFIKTIGSALGSENPIAQGARWHGTFGPDEIPEAHKNKILDFTICVGPYMLEEWYEGQSIIFKRNQTWVEPNRYNIEGIKLTVIDASTNADAIYNEFNSGHLDSCGIPIKHIPEEKGQPRVYKTKGDSTFKLNINSCDQKTWDELFAVGGKINPEGSDWTLKPCMSNDHFLKGLFFSINRKQFAENRGVNPSINYFADSYLYDPENGKSYNDSEAHKNAVKDYEVYDSQGNSLYGYSQDLAIRNFKQAVDELVDAGKLVRGTSSNPTKISFKITWMYETDIKEYGDDIKTYFETAFNNPQVSNGEVILEVEQEAVKNWQDVYEQVMMKGQFDLGFGAISGNTYNPLNFLQVLKSDNESGFTLNWGTDTSKVSDDNPIVYDGKIWSFDALWAVADHGGVVESGRYIKPVKKSYIEYTQNNFNNGGSLLVTTNFFGNNESDTVKFEITRVSIYVQNGSNYDYDKNQYTVENGKIKLTISSERAREIANDIMTTKKLDDPNKQSYNPNPFVTDKYGVYWTVEVYYNLSIKDPKTGEWGTPSENYVTAAQTEDTWKDQGVLL